MIYLQLFLSFLKIGAFSFGGGYAAMPMIQQQVVDAYHWLSVSEFGDLVTISQMTPGPIAINAATFVGSWMARSIMCNDGMRIPGVCDRYSDCLFLCKISSYGRTTNGVKYLTPCGDRTDLNFWNYDPYAGIFSGKSYRSSTDQLDTGWYFYYLYVPFIEKEKRSDHCHAVCRCAKCDRKFFDGNINKIIGSDRFE